PELPEGRRDLPDRLALDELPQPVPDRPRPERLDKEPRRPAGERRIVERREEWPRQPGAGEVRGPVPPVDVGPSQDVLRLRRPSSIRLPGRPEEDPAPAHPVDVLHREDAGGAPAGVDHLPRGEPGGRELGPDEPRPQRRDRIRAGRDVVTEVADPEVALAEGEGLEPGGPPELVA